MTNKQQVDEAVERIANELSIHAGSTDQLLQDLHTVLISHAEQAKVLEWLEKHSESIWIERLVDSGKVFFLIRRKIDRGYLGQGPTLSDAVLFAIEKEGGE